MNLRADFEKLRQAHGACQPEGALRAYSALHGRWQLACERGSLAFEVWLTPAAKPRVDRVTWEEDAPRGPREALCVP